jgi:hypothetical protein
MKTQQPKLLAPNHYGLVLTEGQVLAIAEDAARNPEGYNAGLRSYPITEEDTDHNHWSGSYSMDQALRWHKTKWPHGIKLCREIAVRVKPELKRLTGHLELCRREIASITGRRINQQAVVEDRPEQFFKEVETQQGVVGNNKLVNVFIQCGYSWMTDVKDVIRFGLTLAETINLLELYNIARFKITMVMDVSGLNGNRLTILIPFKHYQQSLPKNRLISTIAAPYFLRRFMLCVIDTMKDLLRPSNNSYGYPNISPDATQQAIKLLTTKAPVNAYYTLNNLDSNAVLEKILLPLCHTTQQQQQLKHLLSCRK